MESGVAGTHYLYLLRPGGRTSNICVRRLQQEIDLRLRNLILKFFSLSGDFLDIDLITLAPRAFFKVVFSDGEG
jgi:hypothetical protein